MSEAGGWSRDGGTGIHGGNGIEQGLDGEERVSWGYPGERVLDGEDNREPTARASLCD